MCAKQRNNKGGFMDIKWKGMNGWSEEVRVKCSKCGFSGKVGKRFFEVAGDERLNLYKVVLDGIVEYNVCPHCRNEIDVNFSYWRRKIHNKNKDGKDVCRYSVLWLVDDTARGSVESLGSPYDTFAIEESKDLSLDPGCSLELVDLLYNTTHDEALLTVSKSLKNGKSVESVIPELKRIIDSHDDVLKEAYWDDYPQ